MTSEQFIQVALLILVVGWGLTRLFAGILFLFQYRRLMVVEARLRLPRDETIPTPGPESRWDAIVFVCGSMWFRHPTYFSKLVTNPIAARIYGVVSLLLGLLLIAGGFVGLTEVFGDVG